MSWLGSWWRRLRLTFSGIRARDIDAAVRDGKGHADRILQRAGAVHINEYPASLAQLRMRRIVDAVDGRDAAALEREVHALARQIEAGKWFWSHPLIRIATDRAIEAALNAGHTERALQLFVAFRREHGDRLTASGALVERLARQRRGDRHCVAAYLEYLLTVQDRVGEGYREVLDALRQACDSDTARAEEYCRWARDIGGMSWASVILMKRLRLGGRLDEAKAEADRLDTLRDGDAVRCLEVGLVYRALRQWKAACRNFAQAATAEGADDPQRRLASVLHAEAQLHDIDAALWNGTAAGGVPHQWAELRQRLLAAVPAETEAVGSGRQTPAQSDEEVRPVALWTLLRISRRVEEPRQALGSIPRLAMQPLAAEAMSRHLPVLLIESGQMGTLDGRIGPVAPADLAHPARFHTARWMLAQGRPSRLMTAVPDELADCSFAADPAGALLAADYHIRLGRAVDAGRLLDQYVWRDDWLDEVVVELRVRCALESGDAEEASRILAGSQAWLLPLLVREVFGAELLAARRDWSQAHRSYQELLSREPTAPRVLSALGWFALDLGQDSLAREAFERLRRIEPGNRYARIGVRLAEGTWPADVESLIPEEPRLPRLAVPLARRLARAGRCELARQLTATLGIEPTSSIEAAPA